MEGSHVEVTGMVRITTGGWSVCCREEEEEDAESESANFLISRFRRPELISGRSHGPWKPRGGNRGRRKKEGGQCASHTLSKGGGRRRRK